MAKKQIIVCIILILLAGSSTAAQDLIDRRFDVVLIVDESASMGMRGMGGRARSDPRERRIGVIGQLENLFFRASQYGAHNQDLVSFRYCIIEFGTEARLTIDWTDIDFNRNPQPPSMNRLRARNMGWTNYEEAFALAEQQFAAIDYGKVDGDPQPRNLVVLFLTDGEPSLRHQPRMGSDPRFWDRFSGQINTVKAQNPNFQLFVIAFFSPDAPEGTFWRENQPRWQALGAEMEVLEKDEPESEVYLKMEEIVRELYAFEMGGPPGDGELEIPCLVEMFYYDLYLLQGFREITLVSPTGKRYAPDLVHATRAEGKVARPESGTWKIENYELIKDNFDFRYQFLSPEIRYIYPGDDKMLVNIDRQMVVTVVLPKDQEFKTEDLTACGLTGIFGIDEDGDGKEEKTLDLVPGLKDGVLELTSSTTWAPKKSKGTVRSTFYLLSNGVEVIKHERELGITNKKMVRPHVKLSTRAFGNSGTVRCRVSFFKGAQKLRLNEVFKNPELALQLLLFAENDEQGYMQYGSNGTLAANPGFEPVIFGVRDENTLQATVKLKRQDEGRPAGWLSGLWAMLSGASADLGFRISERPGAERHEDVVLVQASQAGGGI